jgi:hypothetical protein
MATFAPGLQGPPGMVARAIAALNPRRRRWRKASTRRASFVRRERSVRIEADETRVEARVSRCGGGLAE